MPHRWAPGILGSVGLVPVATSTDFACDAHAKHFLDVPTPKKH